MPDRCPWEFDTEAHPLRCERPPGHHGLHRYDRYAWASGDSRSREVEECAS